MRSVSYLFAEISFAEFSRQLLNEAISRIRSEQQDYLLNVNESEYLAHLESSYSLEPIAFHIEQISMDAEETMVSDHTSEHVNFVRLKKRTQEGRFEYEFHLPGDHGRPVHVAVLCFHLPG
jgi:hypothetical protein